MSKHKKRIYNSKSRVAQAARTKERILLTAKHLFEAEGFEPVTIEKLARAADVSAPTIYSLFQSKCGLLRALMDEALPTDQREALVEEGNRGKSAKGWLRIAAKISRQMYDAEKAQMGIFQGAAVVAPEFKELEKEREQRRYTRQEQSVKDIAEEKPFKNGVNLTQARDILWAFTGRDMYRMLVIERGWTSDEYEKWLGDTLIETLIESGS
jgi:AcrR family transcriptional regulator